MTHFSMITKNNAWLINQLRGKSNAALLKWIISKDNTLDLTGILAWPSQTCAVHR